jgi:aminopeptidase N
MSRPVLLDLASAGLLLVVAACGTGETTLTLLDSSSRHPIEGALIYASGELTVFRSDVHGKVDLPPGWGRQGVSIWAKDHRPLEVELSVMDGPVLLTFEESRVNPGEARYVFDRADTLRGTYGPFRENNDLLTYDLDITVDPAERFVAGVNTIRFRMLEDGDRIQLDLFENMAVDSILMRGEVLDYTREANAVFVDFPRTLRKDEVYALDFHYSGNPLESGRFGGFAFRQDSLGNPWVITACQNIGASLWWPNKDQQPDEPDSMTMAVTVPSDLVDVSNGRLVGVEELGNGNTRYSWKIHYPINNYSVSVNIGRYTHFSDTLGNLSLDFYALPYHVEEARQQFAQAEPMLRCFQDRLGPYPFPLDGYKLIEVPYSGMEHQSAVAYGNLFRNGYLGRDWTGVGISPRFDFIIVHESAHEWFGNSVTANDVSDAWIHEGWGTYLEGVFVECMWGYEDAITYLNGYQGKVGNTEPIIGPTGVNHWPTQDQYFKGALFLNTLRHVVDDDEVWWTLLQDYTDHFKYRNIWTQDVINFFNVRLGRDLRPIFQQYLYHPSIPVLEVRGENGSMAYRWRADVEDFDMPVRVRLNGKSHMIFPTLDWASEPLDGAAPEDWQPATDLFFIGVERG